MQEMQETWVQSLGQEDPLEEEMATHSSILAWEIPWTRGAWWALVYAVTKTQTWLSMHACRQVPYREVKWKLNLKPCWEQRSIYLFSSWGEFPKIRLQRVSNGDRWLLCPHWNPHGDRVGKELGGRFRVPWTHIYLWLIPADVWQEPSQYCKVIILQLKLIIFKKELIYRRHVPTAHL